MRQLQILIILGAMGTGVIVLPRRIADLMPNSLQDGWIVAVLLTLAAMAIAALICFAIRCVESAVKEKNPSSFLVSVQLLMSKPVANIIFVLLLVKIIIAAAFEIRIFMTVTNEILLPLTPLPVIGGLMLLLCAYAAAKGIETRARVAEVLFIIMILPFLFLFIFAVYDADFTNLQPVLRSTSPRTVAFSIFRLGFIFTGLECLLLISPFVKKDKPLIRPVVSAVAFAGIIVTGITILTIAAFGQGLINEPWPVLRMMDMINLPGSFIERQEALVFSFWIITVFVLGSAMLFFGGVLFNDLTKQRNNKLPIKFSLCVVITAVLVFIVCLIPLDKNEIYYYLDIMYMTSGLFFLVIFPLILILAAKLNSWSKIKLAGKNISAVLLFFITLLFFTSCWDRVEIENRAFVVAIGVDAYEETDASENRFTITLSVPVLEKENEENNDDDPPKHIKTASGKTIAETLKNLDAKSDKRLYYGQAKLLLLGENLIERPDLVSEVIKSLESKSDIDVRIHVLVAEDVIKILETTPPGETLPGLYVSDIYRHKHKLGGNSFALDLERLSSALSNEKASGAIIPKIISEKDELKLDGAALLKNNKKVDELSHDELKGLLWGYKKAGEGAVVTSGVTSMEVENHRTKIKFINKLNYPLTAVVDVKINGTIGEYHDLSNEEKQKLEMIFAAEISDELLKTINKLQNEINIDGLNLLEHLRKNEHNLYKRYSKKWDDAYPKVNITPQVKVTIS